MTKAQLLDSIISDLGANYKTDDNQLLSTLLDEVLNDALRISNRDKLATGNSALESQIDILSSNIRRCTKTIYLQRGAEDVSSQTLSGLNSAYDNAVETMRQSIIKSGKRIIY